MPMPGTSQPQLHPDTLTAPSNQTLRRATGARSSERRPPGLSAPLAQPHIGRGPQTPSPGAPRGDATPWGVTLEGLAGALRQQRLCTSPGQPVPFLSARSLPGQRDAGVLADRQQGPQESHSHGYQRSQARSWGSGQTPGTRRKGKRTKAKNPPPAQLEAPQQGPAWLPGEELVPR